MSNTVDNIDDIVLQVKQGEPLSKIADERSVSIHRIRSMLSAIGTSVSELRPSVKAQIEASYPRWKEARIKSKEAAAELGISHSSLLTNLKNMGLTLSGSKVSTAPHDPELLKAADAVIERLITQGGSIRAIARDLGFSKLEPSIRKIIAQRNLDPDEYRYLNRRFNDWLVLQGKPQPVGPSDRILRCKCLRCGNDFDVHYSNLVSGKSKCCNSCADNSPIAVVIKETGEVFKSIRSAAASLDCLDQYQNIRLALEGSNSFTINGQTILLHESTFTES